MEKQITHNWLLTTQFVTLTIIFFIVIAIVSLYFGFQFTINNDIKIVKPAKPDSYSNLHIFKLIYLNNMFISIILISGFLTANLSNLAFFCYNFFQIGCELKLLKFRLEYADLLKLTLPHGIFEFFWIFMALYLSLLMFQDLCLFLFNNKINFANVIKKRALFFCYLQLVVFVSASIEVFLTPYLI